MLSAPLFRAGPTYPVIFANDLKGDSGRHVQGVRAFLVKDISHPWGLVADHPENEGSPITEAYDEYAKAVCAPAGIQYGDVIWFGLDKDGQFCTWDGATLEPIVEPSHETGLCMAFQARLSKLGLRHDGGGLRTMLDAATAPFMPIGAMHLN